MRRLALCLAVVLVLVGSGPSKASIVLSFEVNELGRRDMWPEPYVPVEGQALITFELNDLTYDHPNQYRGEYEGQDNNFISIDFTNPIFPDFSHEATSVRILMEDNTPQGGNDWLTIQTTIASIDGLQLTLSIVGEYSNAPALEAIHSSAVLSDQSSGWILDIDSDTHFTVTNVFISEASNPIPEPSSLIVWSLIGLTFTSIGYRRRRKAA